MSKRRGGDDDTPEGGWMGPPPTEGLKPLYILRKAKKGKWIREPVKQKRKDRELRREWERRMAKADKKGKWRFKWPPKNWD